MRRQHQHLRFEDGGISERNVHGHLVTVEVSVEGGTNKRMQLDSLSLDQFRLEGLDTQAVQGRCAVEEHRMPFEDVFQNVPYQRVLTIDDFSWPT